MRRGGQGQRLWLGLEPVHGKTGAGRLQDLFRRRSRRSPAGANARARGGDICVQRLLARSAATAFIELNVAAGHQQHHRACRMGRLRRRPGLARRRGDACRHRHEPAGHLGRRGGSAGAARAARKSRHHAFDEPSRLRRNARSPAQRPRRSGCFASCACSITAFPLRSPIRRASSSATRRTATWCGPAPRSTASIRRRAAPIRCAASSN